MATSTVLKKVPQQAVVLVTGPGSTTIDLLNLATTTQDFDRPNAQVNINSVMFTVSGITTLARNGANVFKLTDGQDTFMFSQFIGCVLSANNSSNIDINFGSADGSIIMGLSKVAGYPANVQTYDGVQNFVSGN